MRTYHAKSAALGTQRNAQAEKPHRNAACSYSGRDRAGVRLKTIKIPFYLFCYPCFPFAGAWRLWDPYRWGLGSVKEPPSCRGARRGGTARRQSVRGQSVRGQSAQAGGTRDGKCHSETEGPSGPIVAQRCPRAPSPRVFSPLLFAALRFATRVPVLYVRSRTRRATRSSDACSPAQRRAPPERARWTLG